MCRLRLIWRVLEVEIIHIWGDFCEMKLNITLTLSFLIFLALSPLLHYLYRLTTLFLPPTLVNKPSTDDPP